MKIRINEDFFDNNIDLDNTDIEIDDSDEITDEHLKEDCPYCMSITVMLGMNLYNNLKNYFSSLKDIYSNCFSDLFIEKDDNPNSTTPVLKIYYKLREDINVRAFYNLSKILCTSIFFKRLVSTEIKNNIEHRIWNDMMHSSSTKKVSIYSLIASFFYFHGFGDEYLSLVSKDEKSISNFYKKKINPKKSLDFDSRHALYDEDLNYVKWIFFPLFHTYETMNLDNSNNESYLPYGDEIVINEYAIKNQIEDLKDVPYSTLTRAKVGTPMHYGKILLKYRWFNKLINIPLTSRLTSQFIDVPGFLVKAYIETKTNI